jgi:glycosyltransferase, group 2 family
MLKQKYSNGYWIGKVSHVYPKAFSIFHFVPFVFVLGIIFSLLMLPFTKIFVILLGVAYLLFTLLVTLMTIINNKFNVTLLIIPVLLFLVHFSYGMGTLVGLTKGFSWKKEYYSN